MARQSDTALRSLQRMQATRDKQLAEQHPAAMERAGYWFKEIVPPDPTPPPPAVMPRDPAEPEPTEADIDAETELYAVMYPDRAERIRAAGGLPARLDFGAPKPEIVARLLKANRPKAEFLHAAQHRRMIADNETEPSWMRRHRKVFNTEDERRAPKGHGSWSRSNTCGAPWPPVRPPC